MKGRPVERLLAHNQLAAGFCLALAGGLSWAWLLARSGGASAASAVTGMPAMAPDAWSVAYLAPAFAMWALMMAAMMLPSAAPMILLYARFAAFQPGGLPRTGVFAAAYLAVWAAFSIAAAAAQAWLVSRGFVSAMALAVGGRHLAAVLLLLAGLYQLTPLKRACLGRCRSPAAFLVGRWRPGAAGALRLGLAHGAYCLGCCWALMLLLFVGGVMNLAWVAMLAAVVMAEKLTPARLRLSGAIGLSLLAGGAFLLVR